MRKMTKEKTNTLRASSWGHIADKIESRLFPFLFLALAGKDALTLSNEAPLLLPALLSHSPLLAYSDRLSSLCALLIRVYLILSSLLIAYLLLRRSPTPQKTPNSLKEIFIPLLATFGSMGNSLLLDFAPKSLNIVIFPQAWLGLASIIGSLLVGFNLILSVIALWQLNTSFGVFVQVREPVMTGIYAYVRHPMYASYFGISLGICLMAPRLPLILLAVAYYFLLIYRARLEETKLCQFSESYRQYKQQTPMIIPRPRLFLKK